MAETTDKPAHPLVVDAASKLCRYATQDDIRRMELICAAYDRVVHDARRIVELDADLQAILSGTESVTSMSKSETTVVSEPAGKLTNEQRACLAEYEPATVWGCVAGLLILVRPGRCPEIIDGQGRYRTPLWQLRTELSGTKP